MADHPNALRARQALDTFMRGDLERYREFFDDDVAWHVGGYHPLSGDYRGRDALFEYFDRIANLSEKTLNIEPLAILGSDHHVAMFTQVTASRGARRLDVVLAQALSVGGDGRFTEYWALADDQEAVDNFWSDER